MAGRTITLEQTEYFWTRVDTSGECWNWKHRVNTKGYGTFRWDNKEILAHRYAYEISTEHTIPPKVQIDHKCRNRRCVNPDHLREVTNKQNQENTGPNKNNTSGYRGVFYRKRSGMFEVKVTHNYVSHFGGSFDTAEEANDAAKALRNRLYTHNTD